METCGDSESKHKATQWEICKAYTHTPQFLSLYTPGTKYLASKNHFSLSPSEMVKCCYSRKNYSDLLLIPEATCYIPFYYLFLIFLL